jgi:pyruvate,water dikinase
MLFKRVKKRNKIRVQEKLREEIYTYIHASGAQPTKVIKHGILNIAESYGLTSQNADTEPTVKEILLDFLIGDRRLKASNIRKILFAFKDIDELIHMTGNQFGKGTIGSKALGLETAHSILTNTAVKHKYGFTLPVYKPVSFYLGSNLLLDFIHSNRKLWKYRKLKNETFEQITSIQDELEQDFLNAKMSKSIQRYLERIITEIRRPIIVRSSSKLEDNPEASFAGKYDSYFLVNEGTKKKRLRELEISIKKIWRSLFSADAMIYRVKVGFQHRDEQMGVLLQKVIGRKFDIEYENPKTGKVEKIRIFAPTIAGVGFSRNLIYILSKKMRQEDGLVRLVMGLGTRAVDRKFAHEASLSIPSFNPTQNPYLRKKMEQSIMDCLDLSKNEIVAVPIAWTAKYSDKFYTLMNPFISVLKDASIRGLSSQFDIEYEGSFEERENDNVIVDFHNFLQIQNWKGYSFPNEFKNILRALEDNFGYPVDIEFAINLDENGNPKFYILQSRAMVHFEESQQVKIPDHRPEDLLVENRGCLTHGFTGTGSDYLIYIDSVAYKNYADKSAVARAIGKIVHNPSIKQGGSIAILPGRTGTNSPELGVPVRFTEISEINGLVEYGDQVLTSDISYGTHFYTGMRDVNIGFMPVQKNDSNTYFNEMFFLMSPSITTTLLGTDNLDKVIRVIHLPAIVKSKKAFLYLNGVEKRGVLLLRSE